MGIRICPQCKSSEINLVGGGIMGLFECSKCKFRGSVFPEIENNKKSKKKR